MVLRSFYSTNVFRHWSQITYCQNYSTGRKFSLMAPCQMVQYWGTLSMSITFVKLMLLMLGFIGILLINMSQSGILSSITPAVLLSMLQLWDCALRFSGVGLTGLPVVGGGDFWLAPVEGWRVAAAGALCLCPPPSSKSPRSS